jgi:rSAM/selenodomain-associated transferase 1
MESLAGPGRLEPVVAVMTKVPGMTAVKSRLHDVLGEARATELYRCFLLDRLDAVAGLRGISGAVAYTPLEAEVPMRRLAPPSLGLLPQRGADLGERLSAVLTELLGRGHAGAMAVDSDSPTLPMTYVVEAATVLAASTCDVVLGPCEDGGYYLVGLRSPQPALFEGIPWSTDAVFALTLAKARARNLSVHVLPAWFDVDTEADLQRLHAEIVAGSPGPPRTSAFVRQLYRSEHGAAGPGLPPGVAAGEGRCQ